MIMYTWVVSRKGRGLCQKVYCSKQKIFTTQRVINKFACQNICLPKHLLAELCRRSRRSDVSRFRLK